MGAQLRGRHRLQLGVAFGAHRRQGTRAEDAACSSFKTKAWNGLDAFGVSDLHEGDGLDLPRGLALNSARIVCPGRHAMTRFVRPHQSERSWRKTLELELGRSVYVGESFAFASGEIEDSRGGVVEVSCGDDGGALHLFDLREAVVNQARRQDLDAWVARGRLINVTGLPGRQQVGDVIVQPRLEMRIVNEGWSEPETFVIVRPRTRWLLSGSLGDQDDPRSFIGEMVDRIGGDGPRRTKITDIDESGTRMVGWDGSWPLGDYAVVASSPLVRERYGSEILTALQIASGSLTQSKRKNLYAVKDRFTAASSGLAAIGYVWPMPNGENAILDREWTEVRVQKAS